jgi:NhaA family Na+:H+ antiporter
MVRTAIRFLLENSLFVIVGALIALVWANTNHQTYEQLVHLPLIETTHIGVPAHGEEVLLDLESSEAESHGTGRVINLHFLINDILMALFFAIAGKEVWEATLPGGALSSPRKAATPLIATLGGVMMPAAIFLLGGHLLGEFATTAHGWAIPCATDIAFSYMVARLVFGNSHPAIPFLLLLAIADDAIGLVILAVFYPQEELRLVWMVLPLIAMGLGFLFSRVFKIHSFWPYLLIAGALSWYGFARAGLHPVLGLLPIIPTMPHAHVDVGLFDWRELERKDTLNEFEHWWKNPVELVLLLFGLLNAGVVVSAVGPATYLVLGGLLLGKPLGIWGFGVVADRWLGFRLPTGMRYKELFVLSLAAAIGFTVALFISIVAFEPGPVQDAAKMGALLSFAASIFTFAAGKLLRIEKRNGGMAGPDPELVP